MSCNPKLFAWGACEDNQLGYLGFNSTQVSSPRPVSIQNCGRITHIACGYKHTLLLNDSGQLYSCGGNEYGQLGHKDDSTSFKQIKALETQNIRDVACGAYHNAAISYTGQLYTWGCNSNGQLGRDGDDTVIKIVRPLSTNRVVQVSLGLEHSLVLTDTSQVFVFGANHSGQLGLGFASETPVPFPQLLSSIAGIPVRCIQAGGMHSVLLTVSGSVYAWGLNDYGQLGMGSSRSEGGEHSHNDSPASVVSFPTPVRSLKGQEAVSVSCGESHTVILTRAGGVFSFGRNHFGQLGHQTASQSQCLPKKVLELMGTEICQIACGRKHTLSLAPNRGCLYSFGAGTEGQLGRSDLNNSTTPKPIDGSWVSFEKCATRRSSNDSLGGPYVILQVHAGGDQTFVLARKPPLNDACVLDMRYWDALSPRSITTLCPELIERIRNERTALPLPAPNSSAFEGQPVQKQSQRSYMQDQNKTATITRLISVFSSLGCLSASCLSFQHFLTGREEHGLDLDAARQLQNLLFHLIPPQQLYQLITNLLDDVLLVARSNYPGIECLRGLMLLSVSDLLNIPDKPTVTSSASIRSTVTTSSRSNSDQTHNNNHSNSTSSVYKTVDMSSTSDYYPLLAAGFSYPGLVLNTFAMATNKLEAVPSKILDKWFAKVQPRFFKKLALNLRNYIVYVLNEQPKKPISQYQPKSKEEAMRNTLEFMKRLHRINGMNRLISYDTFYIPEIKEHINIDISFAYWLQQSRSGGLKFFSFYDYPFVFDGPTKARMLNIEARASMQEAMSSAQHINIFQRLFQGIPTDNSAHNPFFTIVVRRDHLISDTLSNLAVATTEDLKKLLRVRFESEEAVDEGGVLKEFFLLAMRDLLSPIYGMFRCYTESRMLWFSDTTMETDNVFHLVGMLCGLAIYNSIIVDLSFPLALFIKLLGENPGLDDLKELDPVVGRSLQQLLDYEEADLENVFCLDFTVHVDFFGVDRVVELIDNGANVPVTKENKSLYVEKYVDYVFNRSCEGSYKAFESGFNQVCSGYALKFFRPGELQALVVGSEVVKWDELRENTSYLGVYWANHPVILWFWEVFMTDFTLEDKKKFLRFLTGCDRVPIFGFSSLKIIIQSNDSGDQFLPVAHTCSNLLDLPQYSSKDILRRKLAQAIEQTEGFGLV